MNPCTEHRVRGDTVKSVTYERTDFYYDLHVPGPENYIAHGLLHHNSGKTRAVLQRMKQLMEKYDGLQVLFVRKVLKSMRESILKTWEDEVLGSGHPGISGTAKRTNRERYDFPNGSYVALCGMDDPGKHLSSEWHFICIFQAEQITQDEWGTLLSSMHRSQSSWVAPFQQIIADCNPSRRRHWLNVWFAPDNCIKHQRIRLFSKHTDNPSLLKSYVEDLKQLTGARRSRWYLGEWTDETGMVLSNWNPDIHVIPESAIPKIKLTVGGIDWGMTTSGSGVFHVWGVSEEVDGRRRSYMLAEVYKAGWTLQKWAWAIVELEKIYHFTEIVADPSRPDSMRLLQDMLAEYNVNIAITAANNAWDDGTDLLRQMLEPDEGGQPSMFFVKDALCFGVDEELAELQLPTCTTDEFDDLIWAQDSEGRILERPDKNCKDHGFDVARYVQMRLWRQELPKGRVLKTVAPEWDETPESLAERRPLRNRRHIVPLTRPEWRAKPKRRFL